MSTMTRTIKINEHIFTKVEAVRRSPKIKRDKSAKSFLVALVLVGMIILSVDIAVLNLAHFAYNYFESESMLIVLSPFTTQIFKHVFLSLFVCSAYTFIVHSIRQRNAYKIELIKLYNDKR
jgi:hypothetical protein